MSTSNVIVKCQRQTSTDTNMVAIETCIRNLCGVDLFVWQRLPWLIVYWKGSNKSKVIEGNFIHWKWWLVHIRETENNKKYILCVFPENKKKNNNNRTEWRLMRHSDIKFNDPKIEDEKRKYNGVFSRSFRRFIRSRPQRVLASKTKEAKLMNVKWSPSGRKNIRRSVFFFRTSQRRVVRWVVEREEFGEPMSTTASSFFSFSSLLSSSSSHRLRLLLYGERY